MKQLAMLSQEAAFRSVWVLGFLYLFYSVWDPSPWHGAANIQGGSSIQSLENILINITSGVSPSWVRLMQNMSQVTANAFSLAEPW